MAHAFKSLSAKPTFGSKQTHYYQSDVVNNKRYKQLRISIDEPCNILHKTNNYNQFYLFKNSNTPKCCMYFPVSKYNIVAGQYTALNLSDVCTASNQSYVNPTPDDKCNNSHVQMKSNPSTGVWNSGISAFYQDVSIDPLGQLFGNTQCGELNYTDYMVVNN